MGACDMRKALTRIIGPLIDQNPITRQILGVCSALAVTTSLDTALVMSAALTTVLCLSSGIISLLRHHIPHVIRLIVQITIIASLVIVIDEVHVGQSGVSLEPGSTGMASFTTVVDDDTWQRGKAWARDPNPVQKMRSEFPW